VDLPPGLEEGTEEAETLQVIQVQMTEQNVDAPAALGLE
jgi:hypothetical protein